MGHASGHRPSNSVKSFFGVVDGGGDPSEFLVSNFMCMLKFVETRENNKKGSNFGRCLVCFQKFEPMKP